MMFANVDDVLGYSRLTEEQKHIFKSVHKSHMASFGTDKQSQYAIKNIKLVKWDTVDSCIKVYYPGNWWHYDKRGRWW